MFRAFSEERLNTVFETTFENFEENNYCRFMLIQFMEKKERCASYAIDRVKGTCGLRGSSMSESNHSTINKFVLKNIEGIHGLMLQLIKCQKQTNDEQS